VVRNKVAIHAFPQPSTMVYHHLATVLFLDPRRLDPASRMKLRRSRLTCRDVNRQLPRLCQPLCNSGPVSGSAGIKERLLLRAAPKGNPRSTLFALPQPESRRGAQLRQVSAVIPPPGGPGVRIPVPFRGLLAGRHCRLAKPGRPTGSSPRILCFEHLERTCTPAGRPRRKSRGRLRLERQYRD